MSTHQSLPTQASLVLICQINVECCGKVFRRRRQRGMYC